MNGEIAMNTNERIVATDGKKKSLDMKEQLARLNINRAIHLHHNNNQFALVSKTWGWQTMGTLEPWNKIIIASVSKARD